jgi:hypothetical protein
MAQAVESSTGAPLHEPCLLQIDPRTGDLAVFDAVDLVLRKPSCHEIGAYGLVVGLVTSDRLLDPGGRVEVTAKLGRLRVPIVEVPVNYHARNVRSGKKVRSADGLQALAVLIRQRFNSSTVGVRSLASIPPRSLTG